MQYVLVVSKCFCDNFCFMNTAHIPLNEKELLLRLQQGDERVFNFIYDTYGPLLYVYARKLLGDIDEAKDMVQELFMSLWEKKSITDFKTSLSAYLYSSIRYMFIKKMTHQKVKMAHAEKLSFITEKHSNGTNEYVEVRDLQRQIADMIASLPPQLAQVVVMRKFEYASYQEIAEEMGLSEKTVRNLMAQALKSLRLKMGLSIVLLFLYN